MTTRFFPSQNTSDIDFGFEKEGTVEAGKWLYFLCGMLIAAVFVFAYYHLYSMRKPVETRGDGYRDIKYHEGTQLQPIDEKKLGTL